MRDRYLPTSSLAARAHGYAVERESRTSIPGEARLLYERVVGHRGSRGRAQAVSDKNQKWTWVDKSAS